MNQKRLPIILGPALFLIILLFADLDPLHPEVTRCAAAVVWIAVWWVTEAIPIPATSLLPLVLLPAMGIMKGGDVASSYMNSSIFLFMGGFLIALSLEKWRLHRRIALNILRILGDKPRKLILGFMIATAFLSMWISNTATAMMMLPIALAVINQADARSEDPPFKRNFPLALLLSVAYSASVGGMGTLIGTPPNIAFTRIFAISFPAAPPISFTAWLMMALPLVILFLGVIWFLLTFLLVPVSNKGFSGGSEIIRKELDKLGEVRPSERRVGAIFLLTAILWITRSPIVIGSFNLPGWSSIGWMHGYVDDGTVAIAMGLLLFLIPSGDERGKALLDWPTARKLPWGILLLFGGGFAIARAFKVSGLDQWIGDGFSSLAGTSSWLMVAGTTFMMTFLTELTSNTGTTEMILPLLAALSKSIGIHPLLLMLAATMSASCAFMLPVATPPNAIVFGSGRIPIRKMAMVGLWLNLIGVVLITLLILFLASPIFDITSTLPDWAL